MSRAKGSPKTGGRKAGTPNKVKADVKQWVDIILNNGRGEFEKRLLRLDDREYIRTYVSLLGYVLPKMSPTTPEELLKKEGEMMQKMLVSMSEEALDKVAKKLFELNSRGE
ncbi:MAG: hypothetical protein E7122_05700 [Bacteroidales bacterium]|nr:hypothetical protein [Bacteroidales bacterium]